MGLYDEIHVLDGSVRCAQGHPLKRLQTKDMDCALAHYYLKDGLLYKVLSERSQGFSSFVDGAMRETIVKTYTPEPYTGELQVYDMCEECQPVCYIGSHTWNGIIDTKQPWCEFVMTFAHGQLEAMQVLNSQTRDDVAAELKEMGRTVLEDANPLVIKHLEAAQKQGQRFRRR